MSEKIITIPIPLMLLSLIGEKDLSSYSQEQRQDAQLFVSENGLGCLISLHMLPTGRIIGKFTTSPDIPSPEGEIKLWHRFVKAIDGERVVIEIPVSERIIPDHVMDFIVERIGRSKPDDDNKVCEICGTEFRWWREDEPEKPIDEFQAFILKGQEVVEAWEENGMQPESFMESVNGAVLMQTFRDDRELKRYEDGCLLIGAQTDFKILCDREGYTPLSHYTNQWWDKLVPKVRELIVGNSYPSQYCQVWKSLSEEAQLRLFNVLYAKQPADIGHKEWCKNHEVNVTDIACDIALGKLSYKYSLSRDEMTNSDGEFYPFYQNKIDKLMEDAENGIWNVINQIYRES